MGENVAVGHKLIRNIIAFEEALQLQITRDPSFLQISKDKGLLKGQKKWIHLNDLGFWETAHLPLP